MNKSIRQLLRAAAALALIGGLGVLGVYVFTGKTGVDMEFPLSRIFHEELITTVDVSDSYNDLEELNVAFDQIDKLDIDCDYCTLEIKEGDVDQVQVYAKKNKYSQLKSDVKDDTLIIAMNREGKVQGYEEKNILTLIVPYNTSFKNSSLIVNMGEMEIEGVDFTNSNFYTDMGSLEMEDVKLDNSTLSVSMGSINFDGWIYNEIAVHNEMGSIEMDLYNPKHEVSYSLKGEMGEVEIDDEYANGLDSTLEKTVANEQAFLRIDNSMGSISIDFED